MSSKNVTLKPEQDETGQQETEHVTGDMRPQALALMSAAFCGQRFACSVRQTRNTNQKRIKSIATDNAQKTALKALLLLIRTLFVQVLAFRWLLVETSQEVAHAGRMGMGRIQRDSVALLVHL